MSYKPDLVVGDRVRHNCEDPTCPLVGTVKDVYVDDTTTVRGEHSFWWVQVEWDPIAHPDPSESIPPGFHMPIAADKVKKIE